MANGQMTSRRLKWLMILVVVVALFAALGYWRKQPGAGALPGPAAGEAKVMEVAAADLVVAQRESIAATLSLSGVLQPLNETVLTAEVEGRIDAVMVRPGMAVQAGQVLAHMATQDLAARVAEAEANLAASRSQWQLADKTQRRNEDLRQRNFISGAGLDSGQSALEASQETLRAREAQLALARQALKKAVIRAPMAGTVAERLVQPGQQVAPNQRLFSIVDLSELEFVANVPVTEIANVRIGQIVNVSMAGTHEPVGGALSGRVERVAPVADTGTRMIPVYIRVANPDGRLKGGLPAHGWLRWSEAADTVTLPREAVRSSQNASAVLVIQDGRAEMRRIDMGLSDASAGKVQVRAGLSGGETVILARVGGIAEGQAVRVVADSPANAAAPAAATPAPGNNTGSDAAATAAPAGR